MATKIPSGFPGNVSPEQEVKLKELWLALAALSGIAVEGMPVSRKSFESVDSDRSGTPDQAKSGAKKKRRFGLLGRKGPDDSDGSESSATAIEDKYGQAKEFKSAIAEMSPEQLRTTFWSFSKSDDPDALLLRYLRARKWNVQNALIMMVSTVRWRGKDIHLDDQLIRMGESGMYDSAEGDGEVSSQLGNDFMRQLRMGKSFLHGMDNDGRPICYVRVRLHRGGDQSVESIEKLTVFIIETARIMLKPPIETAAIIFDMTGFSMANMDYTPLKFMIKCFEANYPESLGHIFVFKSPWIFNSIWNIIKGWLDPVVASKVHFIKDAQELSAYIHPSRIPKELGGQEDWEYKYIEPVPGENEMMKDQVTRDKLWQERWEFVQEYEKATQDWVQGVGGEATIMKRKEYAKKLRENYWRLDPYIRAKTLYDRLGIIKDGGDVNMYPEEPFNGGSPEQGEYLAEKLSALSTVDDDADDVFVDALEYQTVA